MGQDSSQTLQNNNNDLSMGDFFSPLSLDSSHGNSHKFSELIEQEETKNSSFAQKSILSTPYYGIWSIISPSQFKIPQPRIGMFTIQIPEKGIVYIGCGFSDKNEVLNDIWTLDLNTYSWQQVETTGDVLSPRTGCVSAFYGGYIILFGGYAKGKYYNDMYVINTQTNVLKKLETHGNIPEPRSNPIFQVVNDHLYLWGGYNGEWPQDLYEMELKTLCWKSYKQTTTPRTSLPSVVYRDQIIAFGSSKNSGLLCIDTKLKVVKTIPTTGAEPPTQPMSAGMVIVNHLMFFFGGKSSTKYTLIYCCDLSRKWWFIFHIRPDEDTTTVTDGRISELGLFMLPRLHSFSIVYNEKKREIVGSFGSPYADPPHIFCLQIGIPLAVINMRNDMLDIFAKTVCNY